MFDAWVEEVEGELLMLFELLVTEEWAIRGFENGTIDRFSLAADFLGEILCTLHDVPIWSRARVLLLAGHGGRRPGAGVPRAAPAAAPGPARACPRRARAQRPLAATLALHRAPPPGAHLTLQARGDQPIPSRCGGLPAST